MLPGAWEGLIKYTYSSTCPQYMFLKVCEGAVQNKKKPKWQIS
jgi:hypothetical protein